MPCAVRAATLEDVPLLAEMNARLIEDEGSRNPMGVDQLRERMAGWLRAGWCADLILRDEDGVVGYALYQIRADEYFPDRQFVHLRQFFLDRPHRGRGLGSGALRLLRGTRFPAGAYVRIDVLVCNPRGRRFWEKNGFGEYATTMHCGRAPGAP